MPKVPTNVRVSTVDTELQFAIQNKTTGKSLFDQVISTTGIREIWYFGLQFIDTRNQPTWLRMDKKIMQQEIKKEQALILLNFRFKFYPENVADEVIQDVTLKLLYLQVKSNILNEDIYCPAEKAVLLASYQVQAKFLEYDDEVHDVGYLANERLLSQSVISQHKLSIEEWEEKVSAFHKQHRGVSREEAMLEYLKIAQDLEMFGINYFAIYNKKGSEMLLGVDALGINVYEKNNKLAPKISFPWSEIKKISHAGEKFKVRLHDKGSIPFEGKTKEPKTAKKIYEMCSGNHEMYVRRRRPDTLEVQQMKEQKREGEKQKTKDRMALKREIEAREKIEKSRQETVTKYKALQDEMERYKSDLDEAKRTIEELERLLRETQESRDEMESQQEEVRALMAKLEADRDMELGEKQKLEDEIRNKQLEIEEVRNSVEIREEEARRLQEEMAEAKRQLEETTSAMHQAMTEATVVTSAVVQENGIESDSSSSSDEEVEELDDTKGDEERETDENTTALLKDLRADLEEARDEAMVTEADRQHRLNMSQDRDKFKTLRDVRTGNTKRRIDNFENM